ncbi:MAG TPA: mycofactocin precursor MftA [Acidimicrobiales bacterium]|nr:mycofactocin precursor MftA [Acidimicrobiales bacterium]
MDDEQTTDLATTAADGTEVVDDDVTIEDVSIDGMCGVY